MEITIEIPNGATNRDVIKALFPDYTYVGTCVLDKYENILLRDVNYNWLNAPYTKEAIGILKKHKAEGESQESEVEDGQNTIKD